MHLALRRGTENGEVRADVDIDLVSDALVPDALVPDALVPAVLVPSVLVPSVRAGAASGPDSQLGPEQAGRRVTELVFTGCGGTGRGLDIVNQPAGTEV
jgi:hypothetical protein